MTDVLGSQLDHILYWATAFASILPMAVLLPNPTNLPRFVFLSLASMLLGLVAFELQVRPV